MQGVTLTGRALTCSHQQIHMLTFLKESRVSIEYCNSTAKIKIFAMSVAIENVAVSKKLFRTFRIETLSCHLGAKSTRVIVLILRPNHLHY